ncbi:unnamed protein product [marine sediment metagenome]|uniref:Uncharacterized protein n=1 Tax=marine sediment metagenome TaxID=412755 RepID=X1APB2_9ZZZZ
MYMKKVEKKEAPKKRAPVVLMPGGKYVNIPITKVQDVWVLLWNLSPKAFERLSPAQAHAIHKQVGLLLKASAWKLPEPDANTKLKIEASKITKAEQSKK